MFKRLLALLMLICLSAVANADGALKDAIEKIIHKKSGDTNVGILVKNLETGKVKYEQHSHRLFMPASTTKLINAYMALHYLGPSYSFKTLFLSSAKPSGRSLDNDLIIKFVGDPTFKLADLQSAFKSLNLEKINGDIIVDRSMFDLNPTSPGGFTWDDNVFYYAAPKSSIIVDKNCAKARMLTARVGDKVKLNIDNPEVLEIQNEVKTVSHVRGDCPFKSKYLGKNKYLVYGCIVKSKTSSSELNFALQDNELMIINYIKKIVKDSGIKVSGAVKVTNDSSMARGKGVLRTHNSSSLREMYEDVLHDSCNLTAGAITKHITALLTKRAGSDEEGAEIIEEFLKKQGVNKKDFKLKDGTGESRYNFITPNAMVTLLTKIYHDAKAGKVLIDSLPKYGEGTLKYRSSSRVLKKIVAKTGTHTGNSAIAGFYLPDKGDKYAFAVMVSNHPLTKDSVKVLEDEILTQIFQSAS